MGTEDLRSLRHEYADHGLAESEMSVDPVTMFRRWMGDAIDAGIGEANAMVVSTVSAEGRPSSRMVLLKGVRDDGFVFYSNYDSAKGRELAANPACALLLPWHDLERQVRVDGVTSRLTTEQSQAYFSSRPRGSQLGAWASPQSQPVASRAELDAQYGVVEKRFADTEVIEVPPYWGGYLVEPHSVEFWQGRRGRMHDRLVYRRSENGPGWVVQRLAP
ncbi:MAG: pyridoxamine 5'-phosphate oxidase [Marmoricola sp.]